MGQQPTDDDDPVAEWDEAAPTVIDDGAVLDIEPDTAPHDLTALAARTALSGDLDKRFRDVYAEGQNDIIASARNVLLSRGLTNEETANVIALIWQGRTRL